MMNVKERAGILLPMVVTEGVTVNVLPNKRHEYLMTTKEVAGGYGISEYTLRRHKMNNNSELIDGKHFVTAVQIMNGNEQGSVAQRDRRTVNGRALKFSPKIFAY